MCTWENFSFFLQPSDSLRPSLFQTCLASEELPTRLESYRDKLVCLQKIRFSSAFYDDLADLYRDAAVLYLCGMLCVNFSPLWDPVIDIVASFARDSNVKWATQHNFLQNRCVFDVQCRIVGAFFQPLTLYEVVILFLWQEHYIKTLN